MSRVSGRREELLQMTSMNSIQPTQYAATSASSRFLDDVLRGLSARRKTLPSKYFYDAEGSRLFEAICELPEYYLTRTEMALLAGIAPAIAGFVARRRSPRGIRQRRQC